MGGPAALIGALLLVAGAPWQGTGEGSEGASRAGADAPQRPPARRRAVDGLAGFTSRSRLVFAELPDRPFRLDATHVFPDRARWLIEPWPADDADPAAPPDRRARSLRFLFGEALWSVEPGGAGSRAFEGEELRLARLQLELRRVATTWPADLEWTGEGTLRTAVLAGVGRLEARLGDDGRPESLASSDPDGTARERLVAIRWREPEADGARTWPSGWELHVGERLVWRETLVEVAPAARVSELFFVPPDRQGAGARVSLPSAAPTRLELPAVARWSRPLSPAERAGWEPAVAAARAELQRLSAQLGGRLSPRPVFELDLSGRPVALELRLEGTPEPLPEGWSRRPRGPAWRSVGVGTEGLEAALDLLRQAVGEGEQPGTAHLVAQLTPNGVGLTQLVVPVLPR